MMHICARPGVTIFVRRRNHRCISSSLAGSLSSSIWRRSESGQHFSTKTSNSITTDPRQSNTRSNVLNLRNQQRDEGINSNRRRQVDSSKAVVEEFEQELAHFRQRIVHLPALPEFWSSAELRTKPDDGYKLLVEDARAFVDRLQHEIDQRQLDRRFAREITFLLEQSLMLFRTSFEDCERIMLLAKRLKLNLSNLMPALEAACMEGKWNEASLLFSRQIDPDMAGFMPMEINLKEPIGLYAIARDAQERKVPIAENVMDAVMSMAMVNPTDQDKYILAAGSALGRVGAWKELVDYQTNSFNSARLGQTLIGAAMYACILNDRLEEALTLFAKITEGSGGVSGEWQWSGGADMIDPLVRDIAMRAGGPLSLKLFEQAKEESFQISLQALQAVVESCRNPRDVFIIIDHLCQGTTWLVDGDNLRIGHSEENTQRLELLPEQLDGLILPILRHCNNAGEFGLSLLVYEIISHNHPGRGGDWQNELINRIGRSRNRDETLAAVMTALCGLDSAGLACTLFESFVSEHRDELPFSYNLYDYARAILPSPDQWHSAHSRIVSLLHVLDKQTRQSLTAAQSDTLLAALAKAAEGCNDSRQPEAAICLIRLARQKILTLQEVVPSLGGAVRSFLGVNPDQPPEHALLARSDPLLAETMRSFRLRQSPEDALTVLETVRQDSNVRLESIPLSVNEALKALAADGHLIQALELFHSLNPSSWTPDMFITLVESLDKAQQWNIIGELYHLSLKSGCLSEYVGIMAMKAVVESEVEGKIRVVRGILKETCSITGLVQNEWRYSRYWLLKRTIGIRYSRMLMWWNDQRTSDVLELQFAIEQFKECMATDRSPSSDVLGAISRHCRAHERLSPLIHELDMKLPTEKEDWADLLRQVIVALNSTDKRNDKAFIEEIILALKAIEAHRMCDEFVSDVLLRGVRVDKSLIA